MITGLVANALGYDHGEFDRLQKMQRSLTYGARRDQKGSVKTTFQTADLGQEHLAATKASNNPAWTTWGKIDKRGGGSASKGTAQIYPEYLVRSVYTVAFTCHISPDRIAKALQYPERPLFIGRKTCLPACQLYVGQADHDSVQAALTDFWPDGQETCPIWHEDTSGSIIAHDMRSWKNDIFSGQRVVRRQTLSA